MALSPAPAEDGLGGVPQHGGSTQFEHRSRRPGRIGLSTPPAAPPSPEPLSPFPGALPPRFPPPGSPPGALTLRSPAKPRQPRTGPAPRGTAGVTVNPRPPRRNELCSSPRGTRGPGLPQAVGVLAPRQPHARRPL